VTTMLITDVRIFDGAGEDVIDDGSIFIEGDRIRDVTRGRSSTNADITIRGGGRTLMPGLIDAHVHPWIADVNIGRTMTRQTEWLALYTGQSLRQMLDRGFTTVRDAGGTPPILRRAIEDGLCAGPRLFPAARFLSQTGGHGDLRHPDELPCCGGERFSAIVDSPDAVRAAVRENFRLGATHIKIMGSGGVASPSDPVDRTQFSDGEIAAAVDEADRHGSYVTAHCHPDSAIARCIELGVRCIEHGTLIEDATAVMAVKRGTFIVPTMAVVEALYEDGPAQGFPPVSMQKLRAIRDRMLGGIETMTRRGVKMGLGTDLLGVHQVRQCTEFELRRAVNTPIEILRSATSINAEILQEQGNLGTIAPGAYADVIVVDGDPLADIGLLGRDGHALSVIVKGGQVWKNAL
jgi:imidazolonepropionase-like amidohydrolase